MIYKCLLKLLDLELINADLYYSKAIKYKEENSSIATLINEMASNKLAHYEKLFNATHNVIEKEENEEIKMLWKYERLRLTEKYDELKYKISKFTI